MKFKKIIPIFIFSSLFSVATSSCNSNEVRITFKLVRIVEGVDILQEKNYSLTIIYEKNHEYSYDDCSIVSIYNYKCYYDSGAPNVYPITMDFDKLYLYEGSYYTDSSLLLNLGDIFTKGATYVCYSDYTPTSSDQSSSI